MQQNKIYKIAFVLSLLIHILLFLVYRPLAGVTGIIDLSKFKQTEEEPLTFELVDPYEQPEELVETPNDAEIEQPPDDARFLSDKNAQAQDLTDANLPQGLSYSQGISDYKTFAASGAAGMPGPAAQAQQQQTKKQQGEEDEGDQDKSQEGEKDPYTFGDEQVYSPAFQAMQQKRFDKSVLNNGQRQTQQPPNSFSDDANWNQRESSAEAMGGVSLSTYAWDYAPYILYMKRRIREHLYPPQAFVQMGAISGEVTLHFILRRDGTVRDLKVIGNRGHTAFIEPSLNSIRASEPFKSLPDSFPDPYLELAWTFVYSVYR